MAVTINIPSQVKTYANLAAFPASGSLKTIYIAEDTNKTYRWDGSTYVEISASAATGLTVGTTPISSGTNGRVLFQGTGNVLQQSSSLFWDSTNNRLGIGTSTPTYDIDIEKTFSGDNFLKVSNPSTNALARSGVILYTTDNVSPAIFGKAGQNNAAYKIIAPNDAFFFGGGGTHNNDFAFLIDKTTGRIKFAAGGSATAQMTIGANGNVLINTTTDAGFRLDVNGTARVVGQATIAGTTNASAGIGRNALINGTITATANTQTLVGLDIEPTFNTGAFTGVETLALRVTGFISNFTSSGATQLRIIGPSGSNKSLFFFNSSTTFASTRIYNAGTTNHLIFATGDSLSNPTDRLAIFAATGNVGINTTTDAGFKLDVNGTARVSGVFNVGSDTARIDLWRSSGAFGGRIGTGYTNPSVNHVYIQCDTNSKAILIDDSNRTLFSSSNGDTTTASAQVTINSSTRGFLPPRMTTTQKNAIASPATGLQVYDTTLNQMSYYNGTTWTNI